MQKPVNDVMFPDITYKNSHESVGNMLKFLANYGFYKLGCEVLSSISFFYKLISDFKDHPDTCICIDDDANGCHGYHFGFWVADDLFHVPSSNAEVLDTFPFILYNYYTFAVLNHFRVVAFYVLWYNLFEVKFHSNNLLRCRKFHPILELQRSTC